MTKPTSDTQKIQLERNTRGRYSYFVLFFMSLSLISTGIYFVLPYFNIKDSQANQFTLKNKVGMDLLAKSPMNVGDYSESDRNKKSQTNFASLKPKDMHKVVSEAKESTYRFSQTNNLDFVTHTVNKGESLWSIARKYGLNTYSVISVNLGILADLSNLPIGLELRIPNRDGVMVKLDKGQTLWDLERSYQTEGETILSFNKLERASQLKRGQKLFIPGGKPVNPYKYRLSSGSSNTKFEWPVSPSSRRVTSRFGDREHPVFNRTIFHRGIDIASPKGTKVFASRSGVVKFSGKIKGYGKVITIEHPGNFKTLYGHLYRSFVNKGQYLEQGQAIGAIGNSGLATGSNLHFEIRQNNKALNPLRNLP